MDARSGRAVSATQWSRAAGVFAVLDSDFIHVQSALAGRYSLQRELGRGGMGIVYLAQEVALERPVAIKLLQPQLASQPELKQRFINEARTAAKLSHPNIIPIYAVDEIGDVVFFVMAYVDGETLGERVKTSGPLPASELSRILRDVGWGLAYAHAQGVVHRDVKADNIMIERGSGRALLVDFGIARMPENTGITLRGEILGTPDYMSPEQASGDPVDHRSDIYSLGVVAYYALSGQLPFEAATAPALLAKHITQPAPSIAHAVPGLPSKLSDAVARALAKQPDQRFANAEEFADAAGAALAARRETPQAIRMFVSKASENTQNLVWVAYMQIFFAVLGGLDSLTTQQAFRDVWWAIAGVTLVAEPILIVAQFAQFRALLKSGYTRDDLNAAWPREIQRDEPERVHEFGRRPDFLERVARVAIPVGWASILVCVSMGGALASSAANAWGFFGLISAGMGGLWSFWRHDSRTALGKRITGTFIKSSLGKRLFGLAGTGLDRAQLASKATHRPTELAIGMAVDSLFESLPKSARQELAELPQVVRHLEADAMRMREQVHALDEVAGTAHDPELKATRAAANKRLADAVTALETIRLDLLRLTAGAGSVASLTADLSDARAVSEEVDRLLEARDDVKALLKRE